MVRPKKQDFWPRINTPEGKKKLKKNPLMNDSSSKIGHDFRNKLFLKLNLSKNVFNKSWCPKLIFLKDFFFEKIPLNRRIV